MASNSTKTEQPPLEKLIYEVPAELVVASPFIPDPENYNIPVIITTEYRGVFFGFIKHDPTGEYGPQVRILSCRNIVYWDESVRGFVGLASNGPNEKCRVGPPSTMILKSVTSLIHVEPKAVKNWLASPWSE